MSFELTTQNLFAWPMIQKEHVLADLLRQYRRQLMEEKRLPEQGLLMHAWTLLQQRLDQLTLSQHFSRRC